MSDSERPPLTAAGVLKRAALTLAVGLVWAFLLWGIEAATGIEPIGRGPGGLLGVLVAVGVGLAGMSLWRQLFPEDFPQRRRPGLPKSTRANSGRRWTSEDDRTALELHRMGVSNRAIGVRLERSTTAVRNRLKTLLGPPTTPADADPAAGGGPAA